MPSRGRTSFGPKDDPSRAEYYTVEGEIPAGGSTHFSLQLREPLPVRQDGSFVTRAQVARYTEVGVTPPQMPARPGVLSHSALRNLVLGGAFAPPLTLRELRGTCTQGVSARPLALPHQVSGRGAARSGGAGRGGSFLLARGEVPLGLGLRSAPGVSLLARRMQFWEVVPGAGLNPLEARPPPGRPGSRKPQGDLTRESTS